MINTSEEQVPSLPAASLASAYKRAKKLVRWLKLGTFNSVQTFGGLDDRPPFLNTEYQEWIQSEPGERTEEQRTYTCVVHGKQGAVAYAVVQDVRQRFAADMATGRVNMAYAVCNFQFQAQALPIDVFLALLKQLLPEHYKARPVYTHNILTYDEDMVAPSLDDVVRVLQAVLAQFQRIIIVVQDPARYATETWDELQARMRALQTSHRGLYLLTVVTEQSDDDRTYRAWLERILRQPAEQARLAEQALSHVVCANFPLTVKALREALTVQEGDEEIDSQRMPPMDDILAACMGLLVVWPHGDDDDKDTTVQFVDAASLDWLQRERSRWLPRADQDVLATFLAYLAMRCFSYEYWNRRQTRRILLKHPLYSHAVLRWADHAERVFEDRSPGAAVDRLLNCAFFADRNKMGRALQLWQYSRDKHTMYEVGLYGRLYPRAYHTAAYFGSANLVYALRCSDLFGADVNIRDSNGQTVLALAADLGLMEVAHALLQEPQILTIKQPVDVDALDRNGHGPLFLAVRNGHSAMAHLLLDYGVCVSTRNVDGVSMLDTACEGGDPAIVTRLLQRYARKERDELHSTQAKDKNNGQTVRNTTYEEDTYEDATNDDAREKLPGLLDSMFMDLYYRRYKREDYKVRKMRHILLGPQPVSETVENAVTAADSPLCATCASLDIGTPFTKPANLYRGEDKWYEVDDGWASNACGFCNLLAGFRDMRMEPRPSWSVQSSTRQWFGKDLDLHIAKSYVKEYSGSKKSPAAVAAEATFAAAWRDTLIVRKQYESCFIGRLGSNDSSGRCAVTLQRLSPTTANLEQARGWINICKKHHSQCQHKVRRPIPHLRLIDCETRIIVSIDSATSMTTTFLALSYVFGKTPPGGIINCVGCKITETERVIEDAICVTRQLGYHYLWVDRHCIPAEDEDPDAPRRRVEALQNMNRVYENAEVTIVAAAGSGPSFGLPGVSSTAKPVARHPQVCRRVQGHLLASFPPEPADIITKSAWWSRAWTYQEAFLSHRLLFFSEHELSFECGGMVARESVNLPLPVRRIEYRTHADIVRRCVLRDGMPELSSFLFGDIAAGSQIDLWHIISVYAKRHLTHDCDILNAFLGIFQRYIDTGQPVRHICGLPLVQKNVPRTRITIPLEALASSLCWKCRKADGVRRPGFPSWSWTGWKCDELESIIKCVDFGDDEPPDVALVVPKDAGADSPGRVIPWLAFSAMSDADRALLPQNLHLRITAPVLSANLILGYDREASCNVILRSPRANVCAHAHICKDAEIDAEFRRRLVRDTLTAVALGYDSSSYDQCRLFLLLEKVDNRWQRIGVARSYTHLSQSIGNVQTIVIE